MVIAVHAEKVLLRRRASLLEAAPGPGELDVHAQRELSEIEAALCRIANRTYGSCTHCGGAVGRDRIRAVPEAPLCLSCESVGKAQP
jgi:DnaK suppressor protein